MTKPQEGEARAPDLVGWSALLAGFMLCFTAPPGRKPQSAGRQARRVPYLRAVG